MRTAQRVMMLSLLGLLAVAIAASPGNPDWSASTGGKNQPTAAEAQAGFVPNEILVKRVDRVSDSAINKAKIRVGGKKVKSFPSLGVELWRIDTGMPVGKAIAELKKAEFGHSIEYAEPNWLLFAHDLPDDPRVAELWGMHNVGQTGGEPDADIDASEAWSVETGSVDIVIGVIDSGVDYLHEDLVDNIWVNKLEASGVDGEDDDGNGYIDDIRGWDFVSGDNDPMDDFGHGTHTAGTIGAMGGNGIGVAGVNWHVRIMPLKFLNSDGSGTTDDAIEAVLYATSFGVPITNNSWGGGRKSKALESAIRDSGALFVASAGNSGISRKQYPAGYSLDNILSVAATDHNDQLASFSNYGASWVDLAAPGVDVLSTTPNNEYDWSSGTSMAAPHVAGVAGLVMAQEPGWTWVEVKDRILTSVDPLDSLTGLVLSGGRLNAATAIGAPIEPPEPDETPPSDVTDLTVDGSATTHNAVTLTWTAPGDDGAEGTAFLYDVRYSTNEIIDNPSFEAAIPAEGEPAPRVAGSWPETFVVTGLSPDTKYYFALKTVDDVGNVSLLSNVPDATTHQAPVGAWTISVIDTGSVGTYLGLDFAADGSPAVAYSHYDTGSVWFALWDDVAAIWNLEIVVSREYAGVDLAYEADSPTVTYGWGKLYASERVANKWGKTTVDTGSYNDDTSVRFNPTDQSMGVAYRTRKGLGFARRVDGAWSKEVVDPGAAARYVGLAYDGSGYPAIAYSDDHNDDGWLSALRLARFNGATWTIETIEEGTTGFGVLAAIAFSPGSNEPMMMHGPARLVEWNGSAWVAQQMDSEGGSGSITFGSNGTAFAAWDSDGEIKFATRAAEENSPWVEEIVESGPVGAFHLPLRLSPDESRVYIVYQGDNEVRSAWRLIE